jgi:hypothetical protein
MMTRRHLMAFAAAAIAVVVGRQPMAAQAPKTTTVTLTIEGMT